MSHNTFRDHDPWRRTRPPTRPQRHSDIRNSSWQRTNVDSFANPWNRNSWRKAKQSNRFQNTASTSHTQEERERHQPSYNPQLPPSLKAKKAPHVPPAPMRTGGAYGERHTCCAVTGAVQSPLPEYKWTVPAPPTHDPPFRACRAVEGLYNLNEVKMIGEGTFGKVFRATFSSGSSLLAVKEHKVFQTNMGFPRAAFREIQILKLLGFGETPPEALHVLPICECCTKSSAPPVGTHHSDASPASARAPEGLSSHTICTIHPFYPFDLSGLIFRGVIAAMDIEGLRSVMFDILQGLRTLHSRGIIHRDIKCSNVLLSHCGRAVIADFGGARFSQFLARSSQNSATQDGSLRGSMTPVTCTLQYRSPEQLLHDRSYGASVDMWAAGVIFFRLVTGVFPYHEAKELPFIKCVLRNNASATEAAWPVSRPLLRRLGAAAEKLRTDPKVLTDPTQFENYLADIEGLLGGCAPNPERAPPVKLQDNSAKFSAACKARGVAPEDPLYAQMRELVFSLLQFSPDARPSAAKALRLPFFADYPQPTRPALLSLLPEAEHSCHDRGMRALHARGLISRDVSEPRTKPANPASVLHEGRPRAPRPAWPR
eukprot:gnl/Chilomastix_cuspidata/973.p1 GENE.gnl/Chilomastix_cuspidata/973~~gnl/Chilomastix_cuspidata/973.p1  ORF type:complete len:598 (-),score=110.58 gnl/Chilomastix_cuspidata/973:3843-5636(-)